MNQAANKIAHVNSDNSLTVPKGGNSRNAVQNVSEKRFIVRNLGVFFCIQTLVPLLLMFACSFLFRSVRYFMPSLGFIWEYYVIFGIAYFVASLVVLIIPSDPAKDFMLFLSLMVIYFSGILVILSFIAILLEGAYFSNIESSSAVK